MAIICFLLFFFFGAALVIYGVVCAIDGARSVHWPRAEGVITSFELSTSAGSDGELMARVTVSYRFSDGQQEWVGCRLYFGDQWSVPARRAKRWPRYVVGEAVTVSYDPESPDESVLCPGVRREMIAIACTGAVFVMMAVAFLLW